MRTVPAERLPIIDGEVAWLPLTKGQVAIIDAADAELIGQRIWCATKVLTVGGFYAVAWDNVHRSGNIQMHRLLAEAPTGTTVDHIDGNGLDNRRANLRVCTASENGRNQRLGIRNRSGYIGVSFHRSEGAWQAQVRTGPTTKRKHLGHFATALDAALARDQYIRENCPSEFWTFNVPLLPGERGITQPEGATA